MSDSIVVVIEGDIPWQEVPSSWPGKVRDEEPDVVFKNLVAPGAACPRVQLVRYEPGHHERRHRHPVGEFLYLLNGDLDLGDQTLARGTLVYIAANTDYGPLTAGPAGTEFLRVEVE